MSDWISVEDALPGEEKDYLIYIKPVSGWAHSMGKDFYCGVETFNKKSKMFHSELLKLGKVLYWQPLPEPPKE